MFDTTQTLAAMADPLSAFVMDGTTIIGVQYPVAGDVVIPEGVTDIANRAFSRQPLISVKFPSTLKTIGEGAFSFCNDLVRMSFAPNAKITTIMDSAFRECNALVSIEIPETVQFIGSYAFADCARSDTPGIKRIIPEVIIHKGTYVYENCFSKTNIDVLRIRANILIHSAFAYAGVFRVYWETDSSNIPSHAFYSCNNLCEFNFTDTTRLKVIDASAFEYCKSLFSIQLPEGITCIRQCAFRHSGLQYFKAPKSLKAIGDEAFAFTPCLSVDLEDSQLEVVGNYAFCQTRITSLTIRGNVSILDFNIVDACDQLICLRIGDSIEYLLDTKLCSKHSMDDGKVHFDMALILEGKHTKCGDNMIAPLIFLPKDSETNTSRFIMRSKYKCSDMIEGMENAYGRYLKSAGSIIYY